MGVLAAVDDRHRRQAEPVLLAHGFSHHADLDVYSQPRTVDPGLATRQVARAARRLQDEGLTVAADPRLACAANAEPEQR
jgi:hypothetical protein